ncbi:MAG: glycosyltransferase [Pseudomonadota bacterium]
MQGAQAVNRNRGIGRYVLSLTKAMLTSNGPDQHFVLLNGHLPESIEPLREELRNLIPSENVRVWYPIQRERDDEATQECSRAILEGVLTQLEPDVFLIGSFFEGYGDSSYTYIPTDQDFVCGVVLFDLIPLIMRKHYLRDERFSRWYERKLEQLTRADRLLCISNATKRDAERLLSLGESTCANIWGAVDDSFCSVEILGQQREKLLNRFGIRERFILYTGGIDHRKNVEGLIRAFSLMSEEAKRVCQLVIVCAISDVDRKRLRNLALESGLSDERLCLTGYVSDSDLIFLYNTCEYFVFPSLYEGFGLPVLEAMKCGRAVVAANNSSLLELIDDERALFDPRDEVALAELLERVLFDKDFRQDLAQKNTENAKKFSWRYCAERAMSSLVDASGNRQRTGSRRLDDVKKKPRMAFVSPLPPQRSGIADYCVDLLAALQVHYKIDVVVNQSEVDLATIPDHCAVLKVEDFPENALRYDRILYHFGNSIFHEHMFDLLGSFPGTVVLHDAFLSGILAHMETFSSDAKVWVSALYTSHGYHAVSARRETADTADVVWAYPCNLGVLRDSIGLIVHSEAAVRQSTSWYGEAARTKFEVIPLMKNPVTVSFSERRKARQELGLAEDHLLVCSYGMLGPSKRNLDLIHAWKSLGFDSKENMSLVFVGENHSGTYGSDIENEIRSAHKVKNVRITGWAVQEEYKNYLISADLAVQLRTLSRGETSAAVLDCLNYGLPTIVNANGSMNELSDDAVLKLPNDFSIRELASAIASACKSSSLRKGLAKAGRRCIQERHAPDRCAELHFNAVETFYRSGEIAETRAIKRIASGSRQIDRFVIEECAAAVDKSMFQNPQVRQLFVDVSELVKGDRGTGIQRVVRSLLERWLKYPQQTVRVEPVYATENSPGYYYARRFSLGFLNCPKEWLDDEPLTYAPGDIFLGLDLQPNVVPAQEPYFAQLRRHGVAVKFVVYDILPILLPECFVDGGSELLSRWLRSVMKNNGVICISKAVADEVRSWQAAFNKNPDDFPIDYFHLGSDIQSDETSHTLEKARTLDNEAPTFLMVGTLEPRKSHSFVLQAFEQLWHEGVEARLYIIGKQGWLVDDLVEKIRNHPDLGDRLLWKSTVSDAELRQYYQGANCLIAASLGEGFGLPVVEASSAGLPLLLRDIAVFREIAGDQATYFSTKCPNEFSCDIREWIEQFHNGTIVGSADIKVHSWDDSAIELWKMLI